MFALLNGSITMTTLALVVPMAAIAIGAGPSQAPGSGAGARTPNPEEPAVRVALQAYLEGHATGQAEAFRRAFQPDARMVFVRDGAFSKMEIQDYIARAPGKPFPDENQRRRTIDFIDITGDAAVARLTLDYPDVKFVDYMTLLKINGEWRIVSKAFDADRRPAAQRKGS
jgi:hypothetical protein